MMEFHINFIPNGTRNTDGGLFANNHQFHFTVEVTQGLTSHWELGTYFVSALVPGEGPKFVGWRLRPRFRIPESWNLPFRLGVSSELGFNNSRFDPNTITLEIRPIIEKEFGRWYLSVNPNVTKSLEGVDSDEGFGLEPAVKLSYNVSEVIELGIEYYAETGPITHFEPWHDQHHIIFPTLDLNVSPKWELNFGVGLGLTGRSEHWIVKGIIGHLFEF